MAKRPLIAIVVTGDPVPSVARARGSFADLMVAAVGDDVDVTFHVADSRLGHAIPTDAAGILITGSPASVHSRTSWIVDAEAELRAIVARGTPVLGVCFGHQLLAQALGGQVLPNPAGREMGTVLIERLADDPLLDHLPARFSANASHVDTVVQPPSGARVLARSNRDQHQALRFGPRAWGVQFHPEFDRAVVVGYLDERRAVLASEATDADALIAAASETPHAASLLARFVELAIGRS